MVLAQEIPGYVDTEVPGELTLAFERIVDALNSDKWFGAKRLPVTRPSGSSLFVLMPRLERIAFFATVAAITAILYGSQRQTGNRTHLGLLLPGYGDINGFGVFHCSPRVDKPRRPSMAIQASEFSGRQNGIDASAHSFQ